MILNLETVFLTQVSDHDTENLHFPGVGEEAARCEIFFLLIRIFICKTAFLKAGKPFF